MAITANGIFMGYGLLKREGRQPNRETQKYEGKAMFMNFWNAWAHVFRMIPGGDPYVAAFVLVVLAVMVLKVLRSASKYVVY